MPNTERKISLSLFYEYISDKARAHRKGGGGEEREKAGTIRKNNCFRKRRWPSDNRSKKQNKGNNKKT